MSLVNQIVEAWTAGYEIFYPALCRVRLIKNYTPQTIGPETQRGILQGVYGQEGASETSFERIEFLTPGKPSINSRFIMLRMDNINSRRVAIGFTKYDEIKTVIGQALEIELNDQRAVIKKGTMEMSLEFATGLATLQTSPTNQIQGSDSTGWTIKGKVTFNDEITAMKKITASDEITAAKKISSSEDVVTGTISLKGHKHSYTDDGAPLVTQPPQ